MRYVVYGAGAVGGVIGARLALAGLDTTLVARGAHLEAIRSDGLLLESTRGRRPVRVAAVGGAAELAWYDDPVVLLTVKSQQTQAALDDLAAHAPAGTRVVTAQNGVANEAAALRRFAHTYAICVMQPCTHLEPGVVVQQCHPVPGILDVGRFPSGVDETTTDVAVDLRAAGYASEPRADIMAWKHRKLIMNLGNGVQASFVPGPEAEELQRRARAEGEAALSAAGICVISDEDDLARRGDLLQGRVRADAWVPRGRACTAAPATSRPTGSTARSACSGDCTTYPLLRTRWCSGSATSSPAPAGHPAAWTQRSPWPSWTGSRAKCRRPATPGVTGRAT